MCCLDATFGEESANASNSMQSDVNVLLLNRPRLSPFTELLTINPPRRSLGWLAVFHDRGYTDLCGLETRQLVS